MAKVTNVELENARGERRVFSAAHVERLFTMFPAGSGWAFPADSKYEYFEGNVRRKKDKGDTEKCAE